LRWEEAYDWSTEADEMKLVWEQINSTGLGRTFRAKVPGGWFIFANLHPDGGGGFFYPDLQHEWDGSSLPGKPN